MVLDVWGNEMVRHGRTQTPKKREAKSVRHVYNEPSKQFTKVEAELWADYVKKNLQSDRPEESVTAVPFALPGESNQRWVIGITVTSRSPILGPSRVFSRIETIRKPMMNNYYAGRTSLFAAIVHRAQEHVRTEIANAEKDELERVAQWESEGGQAHDNL